jgi:hypothetical protein
LNELTNLPEVSEQFEEVWFFRNISVWIEYLYLIAVCLQLKVLHIQDGSPNLGHNNMSKNFTVESMSKPSSYEPSVNVFEWSDFAEVRIVQSSNSTKQAGTGDNINNNNNNNNNNNSVSSSVSENDLLLRKKELLLSQFADLAN